METFFQKLIDSTLNSVKFGITIMVLLALYIALGSGFPEVREFFEKDEFAFFNWWPMVVLAFLLVANIATVTLMRIPFTPPRYGVWMVHAGIITLVFGMLAHYRLKVEGSIPIRLNDSREVYYDRWQRALYGRLDGAAQLRPVLLPSLPRFASYSDENGRASRLDRDELRGQELSVYTMDGQGEGARPVPRPLHEALGLKDPVTVSVVGYWPYATVQSRPVEGGEGRPGLNLSIPRGERMLIAGDPANSGLTVGEIEFEYRHVPTDDVRQRMVEAAKKIHTVKGKVGGEQGQPFELSVEVTKTYDLPNGYKVQIEAFDPKWRTMDKQVVPLLTMMVTPPGDRPKFRRQLIPGRLPTDWKLGEPGAGPMGKRQKETEPLDPGLLTQYELSDPMGLLPSSGTVAYTLISADGRDDLVQVVVGNEATVTQTVQGREGSISVYEPRGPMAHLMPAQPGTDPNARGEPVPLKYQLRKSVQMSQRVVEVPKESRNKDIGQSGTAQVMQVEVKSGDWKQRAYVMYVDQEGVLTNRDTPGIGEVALPGGKGKLQFQFYNARVALPARIRLEKFEAKPYDGATVANSAVFRDFRSTITVFDSDTGKNQTSEMYMNNPVYFDGGKWIFFQSGWDPQGQRFSIVGVGNRPGVVTMTVGCVMIFVGLLWAFYVKPIIIARMKRSALEKAAQAGKLKPQPVPAAV
jgi:hypothetical protein